MCGRSYLLRKGGSSIGRYFDIYGWLGPGRGNVRRVPLVGTSGLPHGSFVRRVQVVAQLWPCGGCRFEGEAFQKNKSSVVAEWERNFQCNAITYAPSCRRISERSWDETGTVLLFTANSNTSHVRVVLPRAFLGTGPRTTRPGTRLGTTRPGTRCGRCGGCGGCDRCGRCGGCGRCGALRRRCVARPPSVPRVQHEADEREGHEHHHDLQDG